MGRHLFSSYLAWTALVMVGLALTMLAINLIVDPYGLYNVVTLDGINGAKPVRSTNVRLFKAHAVEALRPRAVILGSSRAEVALDPDHPGWAAHPVYNLALPGPALHEVYRYLEHAQAIQPVQQAVLALDFFMFNGYTDVWGDFSEERLRHLGDVPSRWRPDPDWGATLFSLNALLNSFKTVHSQESVPVDAAYRANGQIIWPQPPGAVVRMGEFKGHWAAFRNIVDRFTGRGWMPTGKYDFVRPKGKKGTTLETYRAMLHLAYGEGIDLRLVLSPSHAWLWCGLEAVGLWPQFEQWKRALVRINTEEAARVQKTPFPLWDFTGFNTITTETVPPAGDTVTPMRWYWEASHFRQEVGDLVLDRVLGGGDPKKRPIPDDFGVLLTETGIESHLQDERKGLKRYRREHLRDYVEISLVAALHNARRARQ